MLIALCIRILDKKMDEVKHKSLCSPRPASFNCKSIKFKQKALSNSCSASFNYKSIKKLRKATKLFLPYAKITYA